MNRASGELDKFVTFCWQISKDDGHILGLGGVFVQSLDP